MKVLAQFFHILAKNFIIIFSNFYERVELGELAQSEDGTELCVSKVEAVCHE